MSAEAARTTLLVYLSGSLRGTTVRVDGELLRVGTGRDMDIRLPDDLEPPPAAHHATLHRRGGTYELRAVPGQDVWVNAESVETLVLASGDVIELGRDAAVLRFRTYPAGQRSVRTVHELFSDCVECATRGADTMRGRLGIAARQLPRDLLTQTSTAFRALVVLLLAALGASTWILTRRTQDLEMRLAEILRGVEVAALIDRSEGTGLDSESLGDLVRELVADLEQELASTTLRVDSLQGQIGRPARLIGRAAQATLFIQGSYGFRDPASGRDVRLVLGPEGEPVRRPSGEPVLILGGDGPPLESLYTGTGWIASADGLVVTNRHVALPWESNEAALRLVERGLEPVMRRFIGYLPGAPEPFDVSLIGASDAGDLAVLCCSSASADVPFLELATAPSQPGDDVIVLGYPLGIRALMARSGSQFIEELRSAGPIDFWTVAQRLAERGLITPIATRGIVGQRTQQFVTYDAETTSGGSGGPVVGADGRVVAVNTAILPEFGGSNLGVPAAIATELLAEVARDPDN